MTYFPPAKEILYSWRRCMERGMPSNSTAPVLCLEDHELELRKKKQLVAVCI